MLMEPEELAEMESLIQVARKRELNFAICLGKKPENTIFSMHRKKDSGILARNAKKAGETPKLAWGTVSVKGKKVLLTCLEDPPPNMARSMKLFLAESGIKLKVAILDKYGEELESDGDDDIDDDDIELTDGDGAEIEADNQVRPEDTDEAESREEQEEIANELQAKWRSLVGPLGQLFERGMKQNPPNRTQLEAAWAMANEKADNDDYKAALTIAAKLKPALEALAETEEDPLETKWIALRGPLGNLFDGAMKQNPPNRTQLEAAWAMANEKADGGDYKAALTVAAKLKPALEAITSTAEGAPDPAGAQDSPEAARWAALRKPTEDLFLEAMKTDPADGTKLRAAWTMATEKAAAGDFAAAVKIVERLTPLLQAALGPNAKADETAPPKNVVAFQSSRLEWVKTRQNMFSEMKKLEDAIVSACAGDPDLGGIVSQVKSLSDRLNVFDERLQDILDEITTTPDGDKREGLKRQAIGAITEYRNALNDEFFKDVDSNNGFTNVSITSAANNSLASIAKVLAS